VQDVTAGGADEPAGDPSRAGDDACRPPALTGGMINSTRSLKDPQCDP
jgi:hypothetical protein